MKKIALVCLGNICRSPLAEAIARQIASEKKMPLVVESLGTSSWHLGKPPHPKSQTTAKKYGIDISHYQGTQITKKNISSFDYILAADVSVYNDLQALDRSANIFLLGDFGFEGADVPDPYYDNTIEKFDEVFLMLQVCIKNFFASKHFQI